MCDEKMKDFFLFFCFGVLTDNMKEYDYFFKKEKNIYFV